MKKLLIDPGVCGFRTLVTATYNEDDDEVTLRVDTGCKHVREMMDTLGDTFDSFALCLSRPGQNELYQFAAAHFPPHAACPVIAGIVKCAEAESSLALPRDVSFSFQDE
nr:hypothetical protein [uncultured Agathobaculum sp.]